MTTPATPAIDYDALAKQNGAVIDYDALAQTHGAIGKATGGASASPASVGPPTGNAGTAQFPLITPLPGESFADTMRRGVEMGKQVTPTQVAAAKEDAIKKVPSVLTASLLAGPSLLLAGTGLPEELVGSGVGGAAASGATSGAASQLTSKGLHLAAGQNVFTPQSAKDVLESTLSGGAAGGAVGLFGKVANSLFTSKLARGMVNESLGATSRDVTYGNPGKAILDEGINSPLTGDIEKYKSALRQGLPHDQALVAAGGRTAQVAQKVNQLAPQVDQILSHSTAKIPVADVIDRPLIQASSEIIGNPAMTQAEKDAALTQLGALRQSLREGVPGISPEVQPKSNVRGLLPAPKQELQIPASEQPSAVVSKAQENTYRVPESQTPYPQRIFLEDDPRRIAMARGYTSAPATTAPDQAPASYYGVMRTTPQYPPFQPTIDRDYLTPLQANKIKQAIGNRINWAGNIAVTDEVKPAYRAVFGALKDAVNQAVPEVAPVNERLTNLLAAQTDLEKLMKAEEVGQGKGALGSAVTGIARRAEAVVGRGIPAIRNVSVGGARLTAPPIGAAAGLARLSDLLGTGNNQ